MSGGSVNDVLVYWMMMGTRESLCLYNQAVTAITSPRGVGGGATGETRCNADILMKEVVILGPSRRRGRCDRAVLAVRYRGSTDIPSE
jgi:hypothetical protein